MARLWRDSRLKRALCGGVLLLYLVAALGVLPSPDRLSRWFGYAISEPFPCQSHACGCATAHQCWTSCCCFTPHQRLVWAVRNGITPRITRSIGTPATAQTTFSTVPTGGVRRPIALFMMKSTPK